jgi:tetratricopeptide (TPR) repeat protein
MQRLTVLLLTAVLVVCATSELMAQADAQADYQKAKTAYAAGRFAEARDLAQKAADTDAKNPEAFLLLGKSHYMLGDLDDAMTAWKRTLKLAPEEKYSARMLEALQARRTDVDTRIKLLDAMIAEQLYTPASAESQRLLENKALTAVQRVKILTFEAQIAVDRKDKVDALETLNEIQVLYPKEADPVQTTLLMGQAKLLAGGESVADGLALLKDVIAKHAESPAAATARFELILFDLDQGVTAARAETLQKWIAENPKHPLATVARRELIDACLTITRQGPTPTRESKLSPTDVIALGVLADMASRGGHTKDVEEQVYQWIGRSEHHEPVIPGHLRSHYGEKGALAATIDGLEKLLAMPLPRKCRFDALCWLLSYKSELAVHGLEGEASGDARPRSAQGVGRSRLAQREDLPGIPRLTAVARVGRPRPAGPGRGGEHAMAGADHRDPAG